MNSFKIAAVAALSFFFLFGFATPAVAQIDAALCTGTSAQQATNAVLPMEDGSNCTAATAASATETSIFIGGYGAGNRNDAAVPGTGSRNVRLATYTGGISSIGANIFLIRKDVDGVATDQFLEGTTDARDGGLGKVRWVLGVRGDRVADYQLVQKFNMTNYGQSGFMDELAARSAGKWYDQMDPLSKLAYDTYGIWNQVTYNAADSSFYYDNHYFGNRGIKNQFGTRTDRSKMWEWRFHTALGIKDKYFFGLEAKYHTGFFVRDISFSERSDGSSDFQDWAANPQGMPLNAPSLGLDYTNHEKLTVKGWSFAGSGLIRLGSRVRLGGWVETPTAYKFVQEWNLSLTNYTSMSHDPQTGDPLQRQYNGTLQGSGFAYEWSGPLKGGVGFSYVNPNKIVFQMNGEVRNYRAFSRYSKQYSSENYRTSQDEYVGSANLELIFGNARLTAEGGYTRSLIPDARRQITGMGGKVQAYNPDRMYGGVGGGLRFPNWSLYLKGTYTQYQSLWVPYYSDQGNYPVVVNTVGAVRVFLQFNVFLRTDNY